MSEKGVKSFSELMKAAQVTAGYWEEANAGNREVLAYRGTEIAALKERLEKMKPRLKALEEFYQKCEDVKDAKACADKGCPVCKEIMPFIDAVELTNDKEKT